MDFRPGDAGRGSGRRAGVWAASLEQFFDFFQKVKSCRTRRDMQNALVIGFWEANGVEIWPFPFPKQGAAGKLFFNRPPRFEFFNRLPTLLNAKATTYLK